MSEEGRSPLALDGLEELDALPTPTESSVEKVAETAGFTLRHEKEEPKKLPAKKTARKRKYAERPLRRTGRSEIVSTKIKPEYADELIELVKFLSDREDRPVSKAEVLERAIRLFAEKELGSK